MPSRTSTQRPGPAGGRFALHRGLGDPDALSEAIQRFRKATAIDPGFALAHYRLGVALSNDGQPLAGAEASGRA